jgi:hypothetical protein
MDLYAVMTEIDTRLKTVPTLTTDIGYPGKLARVPAAVTYPPDEINFDLTYGRGTDQYPDLLIVVFVARNTVRQALKDITPFLAGSGAKSIKAKIDMSASAPYTSCADVQVWKAELDDTATLGGGTYLAAHFHCKITGLGA